MKYKAIILLKMGEKRFRKIDEVKFKPDSEGISYKKKFFPLKDTDSYMYETKKVTYVFVDLTNEKILTLHSNGIGIDAEFLDMLLTTSKIGLIGQLLAVVKNTLEPEGNNWFKNMKPIVWIALGGLMGYIIGGG